MRICQHNSAIFYDLREVESNFEPVGVAICHPEGIEIERNE